ncbi:hypothetical protein [Amycolatopsis anabasis]|uniref:hypothetical protein n=1 Tax=Amycolatopsis anabasis TaxID=1840409 RepID=UPI001FE62B51|nr:hypothetical protein [Amycolatopsis anabasis]
MSLDGPGFHVEIEVLETASKNMSDIARDQDSFELRELCGDPALYGHDGVHAALAEFCGGWSVGLDALSDRAQRMGDSLGAAAKAYREAERTRKDALTTDPGVEAVDSSSQVPQVGGV